MPAKKQTKITKAFQRKRKDQNDIDNELEREVKELKTILETKQTQLFQLQRASAKRKRRHKKSEPVTNAVKPEAIVFESQEHSLKEMLWLYGVTSGLEVNLWEEGTRCCIVFHIQHSADYTVRHALNIDMRLDNNRISYFSLPDGFNLHKVISQYSDVMEEECIMSVQQALLAYYDRLQQCKRLDSVIPPGVRIFKSPDTTDIEITLKVIAVERPTDDPLRIMVNIVYKLNHTMPTEVEVICREMSTGAKQMLVEQCKLFKEKPLHEAFDWCFLSDRQNYQCLSIKTAAESGTTAGEDGGYSSEDSSETHSLRLALISNSRAR